VEVDAVGLPHERDGDAHVVVADEQRLTGQLHLVMAQHDLELDGRRGTRAQLDDRGRGGGDLVAAPRQPGDMERRNRLKPDRAPDAGRAAVPDRVRLLFPVLLATRHAHVERVLLGAHDDRVLIAVGQGLGDIGAEGRLPALVRGHELAVHPDAGAVVDGTEMQDDPLALGTQPGLRHLLGRDRDAVPDDRVEAGLADARGLRLRWEWQRDLAREGRLVALPVLGEADALVVVGEAGLAVQTQVGAPHRLRTRVGAVLLGSAQLVSHGEVLEVGVDASSTSGRA